eukprot:m.9311 g.9311  ORF g.9311 m.9311 type:complete len:1208 (+) comp21266_c0_seq1:2-3625(+)
MSVLDRIKTAVRGNPVIREYELLRHVGSGGPWSLWKIYDGVKKSTRQEVSIFLYDKKAAEAEKVPKKEREAIINMLKKGPTQLVKLRHPGLLTIAHGIEESRDMLAFVSEPVVASLANLLGKYENAPSPLPLSIKEYQLDPLEMKYGLLQVAESLDFLHNGVKLIHSNLIPENVIVNKSGAWKIFGLNFSVFINYQGGTVAKMAFHEWNSKLSYRTQPSLNFLAPEYILNKSCDTASDMYTYANLVHATFNQGKPLFESENNVLTYKHHAEQLSRVLPHSFFNIPEAGQEHVRLLLNLETSVRPDSTQMTKSPLFDDIAIVTLQYLDTLMQKEDIHKSQFFKTLHKVLPRLPKRVTLQRALPALCTEFRNPQMIPFVLPNVLFIAEDCNTDEYIRYVLPYLKPVFKVHEPIQVLLIFLQKMDLLLTKTPPDAVRSDVLPMIIRALASSSTQIQELCVSILPTFASMIDYSSMKHAIVPKLKFLCLETNSLKVRINVLVCVAKILDVMDKWMVLEEILPMLEAMPSKEPGVLMSMLGVLKECTNHKKLGFDKEVLATRVIPFLFPLSVELTLNEAQFKSFMSVIKDMIRRIEADHAAHLQQLDQMKEQTQSTVKFAQEVIEAKATDDMMGRLEKLMAQESKSDGSASSSSLPPSAPESKKPASSLSEMDRLFASFESTSASSSLPAPPVPASPILKPLPKEAPSTAMSHSSSGVGQSVLSQPPPPMSSSDAFSGLSQLPAGVKPSVSSSFSQPSMSNQVNSQLMMPTQSSAAPSLTPLSSAQPVIPSSVSSLAQPTTLSSAVSKPQPTWSQLSTFSQPLTASPATAAPSSFSSQPALSSASQSSSQQPLFNQPTSRQPSTQSSSFSQPLMPSPATTMPSVDHPSSRSFPQQPSSLNQPTWSQPTSGLASAQSSSFSQPLMPSPAATAPSLSQAALSTMSSQSSSQQPLFSQPAGGRASAQSSSFAQPLVPSPAATMASFSQPAMPKVTSTPSPSFNQPTWSQPLSGQISTQSSSFSQHAPLPAQSQPFQPPPPSIQPNTTQSSFLQPQPSAAPPIQLPKPPAQMQPGLFSGHPSGQTSFQQRGQQHVTSFNPPSTTPMSVSSAPMKPTPASSFHQHPSSALPPTGFLQPQPAVSGGQFPVSGSVPPHPSSMFQSAGNWSQSLQPTQVSLSMQAKPQGNASLFGGQSNVSQPASGPNPFGSESTDNLLF